MVKTLNGHARNVGGHILLSHGQRAVQNQSIVGDLSTSDGWTVGNGWSFPGAYAQFSGGTGDIGLYYSTIVEDGKTYNVTFELFERTAGDLFIRLGGTTNLAGTFTANQIHSVDVVAEGANELFAFIPTGAFRGKLRGLTVIKQ